MILHVEEWGIEQEGTQDEGVKQKGTVRILRINRPETRNAVNFALMDALEEQVLAAEQDNNLRVLVLTGTGNSFISGGDLREFHQIKRGEDAKKMALRMIMLLDRIRALPCWTLAAVNGAAYGGGWEMLLAFDLRVASDRATFGFTQGKFYLPPGWGGLEALKQATGADRAAFLLASQSVIDAQEALQTGILHKIYPAAAFETDVHRLTRRLSMNDRAFIQVLKEGLSADSHQHKPQTEWFSQFWESREHTRRVEDFLKKRSG